jgi:hypothetical protein
MNFSVYVFYNLVRIADWGHTNTQCYPVNQILQAPLDKTKRYIETVDGLANMLPS